jgi:hypothetical protein
MSLEREFRAMAGSAQVRASSSRGQRRLRTRPSSARSRREQERLPDQERASDREHDGRRQHLPGFRGNELCTFARVHNRNAVDIEVQIDAAGATIIVPSKGFKNIFGVDNLNRLGVRRVDVSATQVPVEAEALV